MWVYLPILFSALFGFAAPRFARRLPPQVATWMLSGGGLVAAAGSSSALALVAFDAVARNSAVAARARWSDEVLQHHDPVMVPAGIVAIAAVVVLAGRFGCVAVQRASAITAARRLAVDLPATGSELSVLRSTDRQAFAVPGRPGRIAVTVGMLQALDAGQRRALFAHERSHLNHHHHLHHTAVHLALAVNPLLHRLRGAIELATERWADEDAAALCRRDTVADALILAATGPRMRVPAVVLGAASHDVVSRVRALTEPAPTLALWRVGLPGALLLAMTVAVALAMHDTERLFELAQNAYRSGGR